MILFLMGRPSSVDVLRAAPSVHSRFFSSGTLVCSFVNGAYIKRWATVSGSIIPGKATPGASPFSVPQPRVLSSGIPVPDSGPEPRSRSLQIAEPVVVWLLTG